MSVTVIVPTFNEGPNVAELVRRVTAAMTGQDTRILFVDDSKDDTPEIIEQVAASAPIPVSMIHRQEAIGGLSGAVVEGLRAVDTDWSIVMDGDLQHPPELLPVLLKTGQETKADVVVASRYCGDGGDAGGLDGGWRRFVSKASSALARSMFPVRLRDVTDPMTGFFAVRRGSVDLTTLRPQGFKILLEILARNKLVVVEEPFIFGERHAGDSKATVSQGLSYLRQLTLLRFGRLSSFAAIGAFGALLNIGIVSALTAMGVHYTQAYIAATVLTIAVNFVLQERLVFHDLRNEGRSIWRRLAQTVAFNGGEAVVRYPFYWLLIHYTPIHPGMAQAILLLIAFIIRFVFMSRVVYRPRRTRPTSPLLADSPPKPESENDTTPIDGQSS